MFIRANIFNNHYQNYFDKVADWNFKFGLKIAPSKLFYREKALKDKLGGNLRKNLENEYTTSIYASKVLFLVLTHFSLMCNFYTPGTLG